MARRHDRSRLTRPGIVLVGMLAGCAAVPSGPGPDARVPARAGEGMRPASESLLAEARAQRSAGALGQAQVTLERAIRIEPGQPALWLELARVHLDEGNFTQAEQLARKADSLAPADSPLEGSIASVIDEALRRQGPSR